MSRRGVERFAGESKCDESTNEHQRIKINNVSLDKPLGDSVTEMQT
jgi:hypothetical protein